MSCMVARTDFLEVRVFPLGLRNSGFSRSDQNTILVFQPSGREGQVFQVISLGFMRLFFFGLALFSASFSPPPLLALLLASCFASRTTGLPGKKEDGDPAGPDHVGGGWLLGGKIVLLQIELEL